MDSLDSNQFSQALIYQGFSKKRRFGPRFDKSTSHRSPRAHWPVLAGHDPTCSQGYVVRTVQAAIALKADVMACRRRGQQIAPPHFPGITRLHSQSDDAIAARLSDNRRQAEEISTQTNLRALPKLPASTTCKCQPLPLLSTSSKEVNYLTQ